MTIRALKRLALGLAATLSGIAAASPAAAQQQAPQRHVEIHPYLQIEQVVTADFGGGDTLT